MTAYLKNIDSGERRRWKDSISAAKRLWAMPGNHRGRWNVVDEGMQFEISGADTSELVAFLNPYNWKECLSKPETVMCFDWEEWNA